MQKANLVNNTGGWNRCSFILVLQRINYSFVTSDILHRQYIFFLEEQDEQEVDVGVRA